MPTIIYHDSDGVDKQYELTADPVLIGRATECQIQTQDARVSRRHARIVWDGDYWVEDLGSSNGVYVGLEKVKRAPIRAGDIVTCGSLIFHLVAEQAADGEGVEPAEPSEIVDPTLIPTGEDVAAVLAKRPVPPPTPGTPPSAQGAPPPPPGLRRTSPQWGDGPVKPTMVPPPLEPLATPALQPPATAAPVPAPEPPGVSDWDSDVAAPAPHPTVAPPPIAPPAAIAPPPVVAPVPLAITPPPLAVAPPATESLPSLSPIVSPPAAAKAEPPTDLLAELHDERERRALAEEEARRAVERVKAAEDRVVSVEAEVERGDMENIELSRQLERAIGDLKALRDQPGGAAVAPVSGAGDRAALTALEGERDALKKRVDEIQAEQKTERDRFKQRLVDLREELDHALAHPPAADPEKVQLQKRATELQREVKRLTDELAKPRVVDEGERKARAGLEAERDRLREQVAALQAESSKARAGGPPGAPGEASELRQKVEILEGELEGLRREARRTDNDANDRLSAEVNENIELQKQLSRVADEMQVLRAAAAAGDKEKQARIAAETEREQLRTAVDKEKQARIAAETEREQLRTAAAAVETERQARVALETEREQLLLRINTLREDLEDSRAAPPPPTDDPEKAQLQKKAAELSAEVERLRGEAARADGEAKTRQALQAELDSLKREVTRSAADSASRLGEGDAEKTELQKKAADLAGEIERLRAEAARRSDEDVKARQTAQTEVENLKREVARATAEATTRMGAVDAEKAQLQKKSADLAAELDRLRAEATRAEGETKARHAAEQELVTLRRQLATLETDLEHSRAVPPPTVDDPEKSELRQRVEHLTGEMDSLRDQALRVENEGLARLAAEEAEKHELAQRLARVTAELEGQRGGAAAHDVDVAAVRQEAEAEKAARAAVEETRDRLRRRVEELEAELAEKSAAPALPVDDGEKVGLRKKLDDLTAELARAQAAAPAGGHLEGTADAAMALGDSLAELRSSLRAASDEAAVLSTPPESVQIVADALTSATEQLETARANLRTLSKLLGHE